VYAKRRGAFVCQPLCKPRVKGFGNNEIDFRLSVGAIPTHPTPTSRMIDDPMGYSVRIAGKYW